MNPNGATPTGPHLTDEGLSAALDERADAQQVAHLAACEQCQTSLAAWRGAQAAWAIAPDLAGAEQVEAAVRVALSRAGGDRREPVQNLRRVVLSRPRRWMVPALAAALAVVLGVGFLTRGQPNRAATSTGASSAPRAEREGASSEHGATARPEIPAQTANASLGAITGREELVQVLRRRLRTSSSQQGPLQTGAGTCGIEARRAARVPSATAAIYVAPLRYQGVAAHVAVFKSGGARLAVVTADNGCGVLTTTPI